MKIISCALMVIAGTGLIGVATLYSGSDFGFFGGIYHLVGMILVAFGTVAWLLNLFEDSSKSSEED